MKKLLRQVSYLYFLLLLFCLVYTAFYSARSLRLDYADIPTWDAWRCVSDLDQLCRLDLTPLWRQHNEHRIIGVQLLYWLDFALFGGHQLFVIGCEVVFQFAQLALLWWLLRQIEAPLPFRLAFAAVCGILMTTAFHEQAMVVPFLVQWYLTQALAFCALLFLWRGARTRGIPSLAAVIISAVIVTYTTGNGMLLWPVLVGMAVLLRLARKHIAALVVGAVVSIGVYFIGYVFVGQGRAVLLLTHPFYATGFMAIFLGAPATYMSTALGGAVGLVGMALTMVALLKMVSRRNQPDVVSVVTIGFCIYMIATALLTAYGRMNPADPTFLKARAERYVMISLSFWASLVVIIAWMLAHLRRGRQYAWHLTTVALTAMLLVTVVGKQEEAQRACSVRQARIAEASVALEAAVMYADPLREVYQDPGRLWALAPVLERRRLSLFSAGRQDWIGHRVSELFQVSHACSGAAQALALVDNGVRAEGVALDLQTNEPPSDIVLTDEAGTIAGVGATRLGMDWQGFARSDRLAHTLQAYAIVGRGKTACPLGTPQLIPVREKEELTVLWLPGQRPPNCANARMEVRPHWIEVTPLNEDPQLLFDIGPALGHFRTLIMRARFQKADRIDAFFGRQVQGRGVYSVVTETNKWVDVHLNMSHNRFWELEHGNYLRFDPVSSAGPGTTAYIAGIWGSAQPAPTDWSDVQFYPAPPGESPER